MRALCNEFDAEAYYVSYEAAMDASRRGGQFNVILRAEITKVDFMVASESAYDQIRLRRSRRVTLNEVDAVNMAAPEDVILKKLIYYKEGRSEKHLRDITGILRVGRTEIDRDYVAQWAQRLDVVDAWEAVLQRLKD